MYVVRVALVGRPERSSYTPAHVKELVLASAGLEDGLEHVHVRAGPLRLDMAIFVQALSPRDAEATANRICGVASQSLDGWYLEWSGGPEAKRDVPANGNYANGSQPRNERIQFHE